MYDKLDIYDCKKGKCDYCRREFQAGEVVLVDSAHNKVFCYSGAGTTGCSMAYCFSKGQAVFANAMRFGPVYMASAMERCPNNRDMPLNLQNDEEVEPDEAKETSSDDEEWPDVIG